MKESKKINFDCPSISVLEELLLEVYGILRPRPSDYEQRRELIHRLRKMTEDMFGGRNGSPTLEAFGSFVMDIFTTESDLDLSINFSNGSTTDYPREKKISALRKFAKSLYARQARGEVSGVQPIMGARVPVLKVIDRGTGVECDISVENKDGITRSSILTIIASLDERFRLLSYLMKIWAKAHQINSSKDHTMNSLTIICLVALHLQTRDTPILPPFSTLFKDGTDSQSIQKAFFRYRSSSGKNEETISRLFVSLLSKLSSVVSLWQHGLCASTYDGKWISKTWEKGTPDMSVEDFLDRSQNVARAVNKGGMLKINKCIQSTVNHLSHFMKGETEAPKLRKLLFGSLPLRAPSDLYTPREQMDRKKRSDLPVPAVTKRARFTDAIVVPLRKHADQVTDPFPTPVIPLHPTFPPGRPSYEVHHPSSSSDPYPFAHRMGYEPQQPLLPFAPHSSYGPLHDGRPRSEYPLLDRPSEFLLGHSGYGPVHDERPEYPFPHPVYGSAYNERAQIPASHSGYDLVHDQRPAFPLAPRSGYVSAYNERVEGAAAHSGYESVYDQRHAFPLAPHPGYGLAHDRPPFNPALLQNEWQHNNHGRDQMFR